MITIVINTSTVYHLIFSIIEQAKQGFEQEDS